METKVRESIKKINLRGTLRQDEPMKVHCTFKVGGPADLYFKPADQADLIAALRWARESGVDIFVLGGGANIVPADLGIRGLVVDLTGLDKASIDLTSMTVEAGVSAHTASAMAADAWLAGLDFIYGMPGSMGGAAYMNARCYDGEMSQVLREVTWLDRNLVLHTGQFGPGDFSYKVSPFTGTDHIILSMVLVLQPGDRTTLWKRMMDLEADRRQKGHYAFPCAGSVFKNDHRLGAPSGKIIDSLGLRGHQEGGAKVADFHANIIINTGNATARDIRRLTDHVQARVRQDLGHELEPEILFVGDWSDWP